MKFKFSLAAVLRIRISLEEREERILGQIVHEMAQNVQRIEDIDTGMGEVVRLRETEFTAVVAAADLQYAYGRTEQLKVRRIEIEENQKRLELLRLEQIKIYETAHRNRKMLSDLYKERRALWEANLNRIEQMASDDNFNARRLRG